VDPGVNIVNGYRKSYEPSCSINQNKKNIWLFGGSNMLGQGSPDDFTIPSLLCKQLEIKYPETCWKCQNFGIGGYVFTQEVFQFIRFLQMNKPNPDLVIFYDGVNDFIASLQGYPYEHHTFKKIKDLFEKKELAQGKWILKFLPNISKQLKKLLNKLGSSDDKLLLCKEKLISSAKIYEFNYQLLNDIAQGKNLKIITVFQPTIFSKNSLSDYEKWHIENFNYEGFTNKQLRPLWEYYYENVMKNSLGSLSNTEFVDMTNVFSDVTHSLFYHPGDWMHLNWNGNLRVANALFDEMTKANSPESIPAISN
jgi:hypothetical protein